jgi:MFS family permease
MSKANAAGSVAPHRQHYLVTFCVLALAALSFSMLQSLLLPAIPALQRTLHTSESGAEWLLTVYLLSAAVATPILGRVGDAVGKEKMIVCVLGAVSLGTLISAVATSLTLMLVGRIVQGCGGAIFPLAFGIVRDEFPKEKVAGAIGFMSAILGIGIGVGIVLAGPLITALSYHWLFWIPMMLAAASAIAALLFVPESPVRASAAINWLGGLLMSGWLVTGLLALSYGPTWGWGSSTILLLFGATAILIVLWVWSEARSRTPLVSMTMMRVHAVWSTNLAALLFGFGMFVLFITVPQFVETPTSAGYGFGATVTQSGLYLLPFSIAMLITAPLTGALAKRLSSKLVLILGSLFAASSYVLLAIVNDISMVFYVSAALLGIGIAFGYAAMTNLIVEAVPAEQTGVATGMNTNIRNIGSAMGSAIATSAITSHLLADGIPAEHGYVVAFVICAIALVVAAVAAGSIPRRPGQSVVVGEPHPEWTAEAEVQVGAIAYAPEDG